MSLRYSVAFSFCQKRQKSDNPHTAIFFDHGCSEQVGRLFDHQDSRRNFTPDPLHSLAHLWYGQQDSSCVTTYHPTHDYFPDKSQRNQPLFTTRFRRNSVNRMSLTKHLASLSHLSPSS
jgi:hypothetical protein